MWTAARVKNALLPTLRYVGACGGKAARSTVTAGQSEADTEVKPFSAIPGPRSPLASAVSAFVNRNRLHEFFRDRHTRYGPIYKEWLGPTKMVFLADPEGLSQVLRQDGKYPSRPDLPVLRAYRDELNLPPSIVVSEGEEWYRVRRVVNQPLMRIQSVARHTQAFHGVAAELVDILARKRDAQGEVPQLAQDILKWSMESSCLMLYEKRLGCLKDEPDPEIKVFIQAAVDSVECLNLLFLWPPNIAQKLFPRVWKRFRGLQESLFDYSRKCVDEKIREIEARGSVDEREVGILEYLISSPDLTRDELYSNVADIMPAAIDTTSISTMYALHQLASHPEVQERLHNDIMAVISPGQTPSYDHLQQLPLLKGVIKETMRMYPVASTLARQLQKDAVIMGYQIPKDTQVVTSLYTMGRNENIFSDPESFRPDRWVRGQKDRDIHPFASLPFGYGTRMCVGRRLAELEMQVFITEIIRRFRLEAVSSEPLLMKTKFITAPAKPVRLRLVNR